MTDLQKETNPEEPSNSYFTREEVEVKAQHHFQYLREVFEKSETDREIPLTQSIIQKKIETVLEELTKPTKSNFSSLSYNYAEYQRTGKPSLLKVHGAYLMLGKVYYLNYLEERKSQLIRTIETSKETNEEHPYLPMLREKYGNIEPIPINGEIGHIYSPDGEIYDYELLNLYKAIYNRDRDGAYAFLDEQLSKRSVGEVIMLIHRSKKDLEEQNIHLKEVYFSNPQERPYELKELKELRGNSEHATKILNELILELRYQLSEEEQQIIDSLLKIDPEELAPNVTPPTEKPQTIGANSSEEPPTQDSIKLNFAKVDKTGILHLFRQLKKLGLLSNTNEELAEFLKANVSMLEDMKLSTIKTELSRETAPGRTKNLYQLVVTDLKTKGIITYHPDAKHKIIEIPLSE